MHKPEILFFSVFLAEIEVIFEFEIVNIPQTESKNFQDKTSYRRRVTNSPTQLLIKVMLQSLKLSQS